MGNNFRIGGEIQVNGSALACVVDIKPDGTLVTVGHGTSGARVDIDPSEAETIDRSLTHIHITRGGRRTTIEVDVGTDDIELQYGPLGGVRLPPLVLRR